MSNDNLGDRKVLSCYLEKTLASCQGLLILTQIVNIKYDGVDAPGFNNMLRPAKAKGCFV